MNFMTRRGFGLRFAVLATMLAVGVPAGTSRAADNAEVDILATAALDKLYAENAGAAELAKSAVALLVFPKITKAGLGVGGEVGKGVLRIGEAVDGYYRTVSVSIGMQAGFQTYGYVMMFMTQGALDDFKARKGFELGVDGSVAVIDQGASVDVDTTNLQADIIGIVFDESGLMANATIEGSKISRLD